MNNYALSLAVLALIGQVTAAELTKEVSADDFDIDTAPSRQNIAQSRISVREKQEPEENLKEQEEREQDIATAKQQQEAAEAEERKRLEAQRIAEAWKDRYDRIGPNDGVVYNKDGTREFWEGGIVGGVNDYVKMKTGHKLRGRHRLNHKQKHVDTGESFDEEFERKQELKKIDDHLALKKKLFNTGDADGVVYNDDGTRTSWDGEIVGGVNDNYAKIRKHKKQRFNNLVHNNLRVNHKMRRDVDDTLHEAGGHRKHNLHQKRKDDENFKEQKEREAEIEASQKQLKANQDAAYWNNHYNEFDGLYHNDDGTKFNWGDRHPVRGVNNYIQKKHHNKKHQRAQMMSQRSPGEFADEEATLDEAEEHQHEMYKAVQDSKKSAKKQALINKAKQMKRESSYRKHDYDHYFNPHDGLIHKPDGSTHFLNGAPVNGVNQGYVQIEGTNYGTGLDSYDYMFEADVIKERQQKAIEKAAALKAQQEKDWKKDYNEFDGLVHKNGKLYDLATHKEVAQPDDFVQLDRQGVEVADRNADIEEQDEAQFLVRQKRQQAQMRQIRANQYFNQFDGLIHTKDGRKFFPNGQEVLNQD